MTTLAISMTGSPVAVAGAGGVTISSQNKSVRWFLGATGGAAPAPSATHFLSANTERSFDVPSNEELYLVGEAGLEVAVTRDTAPA